MKKKATISFLAAMFLAVPLSTNAYYQISTNDVVPGGNTFITNATNPSSCSARGRTPYTSQDHIKVTMTHNDGQGNSYDWGTPNEPQSTIQGAEYWTQTSTVSCESYDGAKVYNYNNFTTIPIEVTYSLIPE